MSHFSFVKKLAQKMNQLEDEINDLFALQDDIQQEIGWKYEQMETLRKQLELYDPDYKTEEEKERAIWKAEQESINEEDIPF